MKHHFWPRATLSIILHFEKQNCFLLFFKIFPALPSSAFGKSKGLCLTYMFPSKTNHKNYNPISYKSDNGNLTIWVGRKDYK